MGGGASALQNSAEVVMVWDLISVNIPVSVIFHTPGFWYDGCWFPTPLFDILFFNNPPPPKYELETFIEKTFFLVLHSTLFERKLLKL
jgi:hypothetical protein